MSSHFSRRAFFTQLADGVMDQLDFSSLSRTLQLSRIESSEHSPWLRLGSLADFPPNSVTRKSLPGRSAPLVIDSRREGIRAYSQLERGERVHSALRLERGDLLAHATETWREQEVLSWMTGQKIEVEESKA